MASSNDKPGPDLDNAFGTGKHISFRDYPSTGIVVLAALVSGLGWLVYKWSDRNRRDQSYAAAELQKSEEPASNAGNAATDRE